MTQAISRYQRIKIFFATLRTHFSKLQSSHTSLVMLISVSLFILSMFVCVSEELWPVSWCSFALAWHKQKMVPSHGLIQVRLLKFLWSYRGQTSNLYSTNHNLITWPSFYFKLFCQCSHKISTVELWWHICEMTWSSCYCVTMRSDLLPWFPVAWHSSAVFEMAELFQVQATLLRHWGMTKHCLAVSACVIL